MKDEDIAKLRLRRQHLTGKPLATPEAVVRWLGAVQAQEFAVAKWSVAVRCRGLVTTADMDRALGEGRLLRTHLFRATWHFVLPEDLRWMMTLIAPRVYARAASYYARNGLTKAVFARGQAVLREALAGGRQLVRKEMADALTRGRVVTDRPRLALHLLQSELDLVVCSGALRDGQQTFALVDDLVPQAAPIALDEALARLATRYFASHGPATLKDFIWWSSLTAAQARRGLELAQVTGLRRLDTSGRTHWTTSLRAHRANLGTRVHMLQAYDEYIIGYTESRRVAAVAGEANDPTRAPKRSNILTRCGQVIGFWRTVPGGDESLIDIHLLRPLDPATRDALETELERYGRFLQRPVKLRGGMKLPGGAS